MPIITADMIQIRENGIPFVYAKTFNTINRTFYNKYINDDDDEGYTMQIHTWYQGLPNWSVILYIEKVILDPITTSIILDTDRTEFAEFVEFYHSLYNHILEKVEYDESLLQRPDVYAAATKYVQEEQAKYTSTTKNHIYQSILDLMRNQTYYSANNYSYHNNILQDAYNRKRDSMKSFNGDAYNASKEKLLKQIFAKHALPEPTLQQYNDWLSSPKGLDILDRWSLNRYELMTVYAKLVTNPSLDIDKFIRNNYNTYNTRMYYSDDYSDYSNDDNDSDYSNDDDNDIEDEEVANFNINI